MCGRFTLTQSAEKITEFFGLSEVSELAPRYNIAPSQLIAAIVQDKENQENKLKWMRWGLIPSWAKDTKIGYKLINARSETLTEKPSFRNAFKRRRCLIIADGFYEWQKQEKHKQPYYIQLRDKQPFAFAGLWETWQPEDGEAIISCTIITTEANAVMQPIHDRMPVILSPDVYEQWLDPTFDQSNDLLESLKPYDSEMIATPVSNVVNNPVHDQPECVEPI
jgi:putative SOS response-associated peptidase YedK